MAAWMMIALFPASSSRARHGMPFHGVTLERRQRQNTYLMAAGSIQRTTFPVESSLVRCVHVCCCGALCSPFWTSSTRRKRKRCCGGPYSSSWWTSCPAMGTTPSPSKCPCPPPVVPPRKWLCHACMVRTDDACMHACVKSSWLRPVPPTGQ
jgi:hypothetical protein